MHTLESPIRFRPQYMKRVWGGRELEQVFGRVLPDEDSTYGESWEIVDRAECQSMVRGGGYDQYSLHQLWTLKRVEVFGEQMPEVPRFPLLFKILDASQNLSVQVHPPMRYIEQNGGGEPKTEMWFVAKAKPDTRLFVGLKEGVTEDLFREAIHEGKVSSLVHEIPVEERESICIESGRLHAIGAGALIYEVQENSDTTYRVHDWGRMGLDGLPRELHVEESLACIDFDDIEPGVANCKDGVLSDCEHFRVEQHFFDSETQMRQQNVNRFAVITVVKGVLHASNGECYREGEFFLLPAQAGFLRTEGEGSYLETTIPVPRTR